MGVALGSLFKLRAHASAPLDSPDTGAGCMALGGLTGVSRQPPPPDLPALSGQDILRAAPSDLHFALESPNTELWTEEPGDSVGRSGR